MARIGPAEHRRIVVAVTDSEESRRAPVTYVLKHAGSRVMVISTRTTAAASA